MEKLANTVYTKDEKAVNVRHAVLIKLIGGTNTTRTVSKYIVHNHIIFSEKKVRNKLSMTGISQKEVAFAMLIYTDDLSCEWVSIDELQKRMEFDKVIVHNARYDGKIHLLNEPYIEGNIHKIGTSILGKFKWKSIQYYLTTCIDKPFKTEKELENELVITDTFDNSWVPELDLKVIAKFWNKIKLYEDSMLCKVSYERCGYSFNF